MTGAGDEVGQEDFDDPGVVIQDFALGRPVRVQDLVEARQSQPAVPGLHYFGGGRVEIIANLKRTSA